MTTRDIIADIDAILRGDISGPEQVRGVLGDAKAEIERLRALLADMQPHITQVIYSAQAVDERLLREFRSVNGQENASDTPSRITADYTQSGMGAQPLPTTEDPTHG